METSIKLTIYFEDPFWVGVLERVDEGKLMTCRIVFGQEPKDTDVYGLLLRRWPQLRFGAAVAVTEKENLRINPKRLQRRVKRELAQQTVSSKAQEAMRLAYENCRVEKQQQSRQQLREQDERKFALRQAKRKAKQKGH